MGRGVRKEPTKMTVMSYITVNGKQISMHSFEEGIVTKHSVIVKSPSGTVRVFLHDNKVRYSTFRLPRKVLEAGKAVVRTERVNLRWTKADTLKEYKALRIFEMYDEKKHGKREDLREGLTATLSQLEKKAEAEMKGSSESTNNG